MQRQARWASADSLRSTLFSKMLLRPSERFRLESAKMEIIKLLGAVQDKTIDVAWLSFKKKFLSDSPAGTQWKPTLTVVVLTGMQPGRQRSTGSTE